MGVATAVAIGGLAISAGSSAISFIQANKQRKLQKEAEADAAKAMEDARKKISINFYREMGIQKEPYELAREAELAQGQAMIDAAQQGERGVGAVAGALQMSQNAAQQEIRTAMGKEQRDIQEMVLDEESRLRDVGAQLDLEEAAGAQQAAADAQMARAQFMTEGFQQAAGALQQGLGLLPMYSGKGVSQSEVEALLKSNPELFKDPTKVSGMFNTGTALTGQSRRTAKRLMELNPDLFKINPFIFEN